MIKETTDYSIFKKHIGNRDVLPGNVKRLVNSIKFKNLLHLRPILVNKGLEILDGQHRLEAATQLNLPIFYEICNKSEINDIPLLNIQQAWKSEDVLNFYSSQGNDNYIKLKNFVKKYNISFSMGLRVFSRGSEEFTHKFKNGEFIFPTGEELQNRMDNFEKVKETIDWLKEKIQGPKKYLSSTRFSIALRSFFYIKSVDYELFKVKLELRLDLIKPCHSVTSFINVFKQIYNFNNRRPITMDEDLIAMGDS